VEIGNEEKGIGTGSDEIAPLVGLAFVKGTKVLVPLVQHFVSYDGLSADCHSIASEWFLGKTGCQSAR